MASLAYFNDSVGSTVRAVSSNPAHIVGLKIVNTTGAAAYLQVFAKPATSVTLGSDTPDFCIPLVADESIFLPMPGVLPSGSTGLSIAGTTTATGSTAAVLKVTVLYV
jgi:hypothetical protein